MNTVFFTGAGLSADTVPTFRGAGGLYEDIPAEEWLTATNYDHEPSRTEIDRWVDGLRRHVGGCQPNAAHRAIAAFCELYPETLVLTQNVDDLLERAGVPERNLIHLHGTLRRLRCRDRGHPVDIGYERDPEALCAECGAELRADVVLFGEYAPLYQTMWDIFSRLGAGDALVVIGTQGSVIPIGAVAATLPCRKILNNLHRDQHIDAADFDAVFIEPAVTAAPKIWDLLETWRHGS